jgi:molybdenum cofactor cytidylyltransferase
VLTALVLSAGESTRMGSPKALLPDPNGRPFVGRIVRTLLAAGLDDVIVITGSQHDVIASVVAMDGLDERVRLVRNPDPARGQLSSIWTGLDACATGAEGLLLTVVDVPLLAASTVCAVVDAWRRTRAPIVRPIVDGRRGHPVMFDRQVFDELRAAPLDAGARTVVRAHWHDGVDVPVNDRECLIDVDTPADYERLLRGSRTDRPV